MSVAYIGQRTVTLVAGAAGPVTWLHPITGAVTTLTDFADVLSDPQQLIVSRTVVVFA